GMALGSKDGGAAATAWARGVGVLAIGLKKAPAPGFWNVGITGVANTSWTGMGVAVGVGEPGGVPTEALALLFAGLGSAVVLVTVAVLVTEASGAVVVPSSTTMLN